MHLYIHTYICILHVHININIVHRTHTHTHTHTHICSQTSNSSIAFSTDGATRIVLSDNQAGFGSLVGTRAVRWTLGGNSQGEYQAGETVSTTARIYGTVLCYAYSIVVCYAYRTVLHIVLCCVMPIVLCCVMPVVLYRVYCALLCI